MYNLFNLKFYSSFSIFLHMNEVMSIKFSEDFTSSLWCTFRISESIYVRFKYKQNLCSKHAQIRVILKKLCNFTF